MHGTWLGSLDFSLLIQHILRNVIIVLLEDDRGKPGMGFYREDVRV
jgi:hypothetical protein